jgi:hypothetical protein
MNQSEKIKQYVLLDGLFNVFLESEPVQEDKEMLIPQDDLDRIVEKNLALFKKLRTTAKAEINRSRHARGTAFLEKLKKGIATGSERIQEIADSLQSKPEVAKYASLFRNFSSISEQDKESILMDSALLDLLDAIDEETGVDDGDK